MQEKLHEGSKITSPPSKCFHVQSDQPIKVKSVDFLPCATHLVTGEYFRNSHPSFSGRSKLHGLFFQPGKRPPTCSCRPLKVTKPLASSRVLSSSPPLLPPLFPLWSLSNVHAPCKALSFPSNYYPLFPFISFLFTPTRIMLAVAVP